MTRMRARAVPRPLPGARPPSWTSSLRGSIRALGAALGVLLVASLAAAAGLLPTASERLALVLGAWALFGALVAHFFLPGFDLVPGRLLRRVPRRLGPRALALTFDDGPHPETTPAILDALAAAGVKATFFLVGEHARRAPDLVRRIAAEGHAIGNHTQRHRLLVFRTQGQLRDEIAECQSVLAGILGAPPRLFRPPHGFKALGLFRALRRHGLTMAAWQGAIRDTDAPGADAITDRALAFARPGRILLLHDAPSTRGQTAEALPAIIAGCRARGLRFVRLPEPAPKRR